MGVLNIGGGESRKMSLKTGQIRLQSSIDFLEQASENFMYPYRVNLMYVDNVYFEMWGDYGFIVLITYLLLNTYLVMQCIQKNKLFELSLLLIILILGLSTNFVYLWPLGYIYWFLVVEILIGKNAIIQIQHG